ncbi:MAG TPA: NAD(P)-dependent oxidoreductase [Stellaceae bacterium]|nr:NAD(P)-dependent oxidoreductase [Stellaceae bacterium]
MSESILLTHTPDMRESYYGDKAIAGLTALAPVRFHESATPLAGASLIAAARGSKIIVSDRQTPGEAAIFAALPDLVAFVRCAVDIRNVAVAAASEAGVLVTHASPGFVASVAELVLGHMVDLGRHITPAATTYHGGGMPVARRGVQLRGSTLGILGYGAIGRYLADLGVALGMGVLVADPYAKVEKPGIAQTSMEDLLARADFVVCLVVANDETENLMNDAAFARMKPNSYFINVARGNLVDEAALARALDGKRIAGAALDVGSAPDQMPLPSLARRADIIATPHVGGLTPTAIEHQALETVAQVAEILKGRAPKGAANAESATRLTRLG